MRRRPGIDRWNPRLGVWMPTDVPVTAPIDPAPPVPPAPPLQRHPVIQTTGRYYLASRLYRVNGDVRTEPIAESNQERDVIAVVYRELGRARARNSSGRVIADNGRDIETREDE